jgi:protocatechuate 3,4-dioxygenase beta subunit
MKNLGLVSALVALAVVIGWVVLRGDQPIRPGSAENRSTTGAPALDPESGAAAEDAEPGDCFSLEGQALQGDVGVRSTVEVFELPDHEILGPERRDPLRPPLPADPPARRIETGEDGEFLVRGLAAGVFTIRATSPEGAEGRRTVRLREGRPNPKITIFLRDRGGEEILVGRAVHADGRPFRGLVGSVPWTRPYQGACRVARTDEAGRFRLHGLTVEPHALHFHVSGASRYTVGPIAVPSAGEIRVVVDAGVSARRVRVLDDADGAPVVGAEVTASGKAVISRERTDADGVAAILSAGRLRVTVRATGFAPARITLVEGGDTEVRLRRRGTVRGRITRLDDGRPAVGVRIRACWYYREVDHIRRDVRAVTDEKGCYELPEVGPGEVEILAHGGSWVASGLRELTSRGLPWPSVILRPGATVEHDLVVIPAARIEGVVRDAEGQAANEVEIRARGEHAEGGYRHRSRAQGGEDGAFELPDLCPGLPYRIVASAEDGLPVRLGPLVLEPGETRRVELALPRSWWIEAEVVCAESGDPLARATLSWSGSQVGRSAHSRASGRVRLGPLPWGPQSICVERTGYRTTSRTLSPGKGPVEIRMDRVPARESLVIAGRIRTSADPRRLGGLEVQAVPVDGTRGAVRSRVTRDGAFRIEGLRPGTHLLRVLASGVPKALVEQEVEAGREDVVLVLKEIPPHPHLVVPRELRVDVLGPDGEPVRSCCAEVFLNQERMSNQSGSFGGRVTFGPSVKRCWIHVYRAMTTSGELCGALRVGPLDPSAGEVTIRLPGPRSIRGSVLGPEGKPIEGVLVDASPMRSWERVENAREPTHATARSDEEGRFALDGLGDGIHRVYVSPPRGFLAPDPIRVEEPGGEVLVLLKRAVTCTLRVIDADGEPVAGAQVYASSRAGTRRSAITDANGTARLEGLNPETSHFLSVLPPPDSVAVARQTLRDWMPADTEVRLGRTVRGVVLDLEGTPVPGARVWYPVSDGYWDAVSTSSDGRFLIRHVSGPTVRLRVTSPGVARHDEPGTLEVTVEAGESDVTLRLDPGLSLAVCVLGATNCMQARLLCEGVSPDRRRGERSHTGVFRFHGLRAGQTYTLQVVGAGDRAVTKKGIRPEVGTLRVALKPGKSITGRLLIPAGVVATQIQAGIGRDLVVRGEVAPDGSFVIRGLVEDEWSVTAFGRREGEAYRADVRVRAPADGVEIVLEPVR